MMGDVPLGSAILLLNTETSLDSFRVTHVNMRPDIEVHI